MRRSFLVVLCAALCVLVVVSCGGDQGSGGNGGDGGQDPDNAGKGNGDRKSAQKQGEAIKSLDEILTASDRASLAGRRVNLDDVSVIEATPQGGAFLIGAEGEDSGLAVVIRPGSRPSEDGGGSTGAEEKAEEAPSIEVGGSVSVQGALRATPDSYDEAVRRFAMKQGQFEFVQDEDVFVYSGNVQQASGSS